MKLTVSRLFDVSKALTTKAGQELQDVISSVQFALEQLIRALRNNLTFEDNMKCERKIVVLRHNETQAVSVSGTPTGLLTVRVFPSTTTDEALSKPMQWKINDKSEFVVTAQFDSAVATRDISVEIIVLLA